MASTINSRQRAQLIRELNKTRTSAGTSRRSQSPQPTISDFDPENEAMMSTRQLDSQAQKLPNLRESAQKYRRPATAEPDYAINTSAIGRAFPDFSQGNTSSDEGSVSVEIGRGARKGIHGSVGKLRQSRDYSYTGQTNLDEDSMDFSIPLIGNHDVTATQPSKQRSAKNTTETARAMSGSSHQARRTSGLRHEIDQSPPAKTKDYGSGESRKGSDGNRRGLAAMHARVRDENDLSRVSNDRPPEIDVTVRNTRFGNGKNSQNPLSDGLPMNFSSSRGLQTLKSADKRMKDVTATAQGTQDSFLLPDYPNAFELVSGVFEDGTPVFSRHGRSQASRFAFKKNGQTAQPHVAISEITVPDDEQAIFLSLKLLQDKVAILERGKAEAENAVGELQEKNRQLHIERPERRRSTHRSDSALGTTDSDDGDGMAGIRQRKAIIEKNRLESSIRALQTQLDESNRRTCTAEATLQNVSQERDSAVSQLGVAYVTLQQLKAENESIKEENKNLRGRIDNLGHEKDREAQQWSAKEDTLQRKLEQRTKALKTVREETGNINTQQQPNQIPLTRFQDQTQPSKTHHLSSTGKDEDDLFDVTPRRLGADQRSNKGKPSNHIVDDSSDSEDSVHTELRKGKSVGKRTASKRIEKGETEDAFPDLTFLSFVESEEIAKLRKTIEQENLGRTRHTARRQPHQYVDKAQTDTQHEMEEQSMKTTVPRKSSMKDLTVRSNPTTQHGLPAADGKSRSEHNRRHSETSMLSAGGRRTRLQADNMTSAFILPDITIRMPKASDGQSPVLTKENLLVLDGLANHKAQNCTVCNRATGYGEDHVHGNTAKETITVTKPVPVSERIPQYMPGEEEPTMRPAQAPGLALATVLKGIEDEITHLKIKLAQYQTLYNSHDPALSKRKRKSCYQKMEDLLKAIDVKSDHIYALYDVLEGQKKEGQDLTEAEVEITLQSIGVDVAELRLRGGGKREAEIGAKDGRHSWELTSEEGSDEELPWEGIETTVETTKSGFARSRGRRTSTTA